MVYQSNVKNILEQQRARIDELEAENALLCTRLAALRDTCSPGLVMVCPGCKQEWNTRHLMPMRLGWGVPVPFQGEAPLCLGCGCYLKFIGPPWDLLEPVS